MEPTTLEPMIETDRQTLETAIYGLLRTVCGYQEWKDVENLPNSEKVKTLVRITSERLTELNLDLDNSDPKQLSQVMRKLKSYQQLSLIERFCFDEVEW